MKTIKLLAFIAATSFGLNSAYAASYTVDPAHTQIIFKVKHLAFSTVSGNFVDFEGEFDFDPDNIVASKASATIKAKSINTSNEKRDDHLRGDDFFGVEKHPELTFLSKEIKNVKGNSFIVVGDLTINGVTKSIELDAEYSGAATDPWGNEKVAFTAESKIDRKDFGLTWNKAIEAGGFVVGDEVKIVLEVQGIKKK